jgi:hypothetical protein
MKMDVFGLRRRSIKKRNWEGGGQMCGSEFRDKAASYRLSDTVALFSGIMCFLCLSKELTFFLLLVGWD